MKTTARSLGFLLPAMAGLLAPMARAQGTAPPPQPSRFDLAAGYSYVHSNAPPGGCGCFSLNGASFAIARSIGSGGFALAGDVGVDHSGSVTSTGDSLTLSSYTAGVRYTPHLHKPVHPFGQTLVGVAHSSGSLVQGTNAAASNAGAAFAALVGGGVDLDAGKRFSIRLVEADYLVTTFDNAGNDHQNNLRINAGLVFRF